MNCFTLIEDFILRFFNILQLYVQAYRVVQIMAFQGYNFDSFHSWLL